MGDSHVYSAVSTISVWESGFVSKKRDFVAHNAAEGSLFLYVESYQLYASIMQNEKVNECVQEHNG